MCVEKRNEGRDGQGEGEGEEQQTAKIVAQSCRGASTTERASERALVVPEQGQHQSPLLLLSLCTVSSQPQPQGGGVGVLARVEMEFEMEKCFTFWGTGSSIERDYF